MPHLRIALAVSLLAALLAARGAFAATPVLVKDIDPRLVPGDLRGFAPNQFHSLGDPAGAPGLVVYVLHNQLDDDRADELWASDGTPGGTRRVFTANGDVHAITVLGTAGSRAIFSVSLYVQSWSEARMFSTDGTPEGTVELTGVALSGFLNGIARAGLFYFTIADPATGSELWRTDGTQAGTLLLRDIAPGTYSSNPRAFVATADRLWFFADAPEGTGLWSTDGSRAGTRRAVLLPPYASPLEMKAAGSRIFFTEGAGYYHHNLWTSDGTQEGTFPIPPFHRHHKKGPGLTSLLSPLGDEMVFIVDDSRSETSQLWISDGSVDGTRLLADFGVYHSTSWSAVLKNGRLLFAGPDSRPWSTRGTRASTGPVASCRTESCVRVYPYSPPVALGDLAVFADGLYEPWVTDGTAEGTRMLADAAPGSDGSYPVIVPGPPGKAFFFTLANELWITDGTPEGTHVSSDRVLYPDYPPETPALALVGERAVFAATTPEGVREVRSTDGDPGSTIVLSSSSHGADSLPQSLTPFQDGILFYTCIEGLALWRSDGTAEGTTPLVSSHRASCPGQDGAASLLTDGSAAWFPFLSPDEYWYELWRTDGTPEGTEPAGEGTESTSLADAALDPAHDRVVFAMWNFVDFNAVSLQAVPTAGGSARPLFDLQASLISDLQAFEGQLYFQANDPEVSSFYLTQSDGTAAGTRKLTPTSSNYPGPIDFFRQDGKVLFLNVQGYEPGLWSTDGTAAGTRRVFPTAGETTPSAMTGLRQLAGSLYFMANQGPWYPIRPALYRSDGTAAGTAVLLDFGYINNGVVPEPDFTAAGGVLFFIATDEDHGRELWRTDGTRPGTFRVRDIHPGPDGARIQDLTAAAGRIWFAADDGEHGVELWSSDGTEAGTRMEADLAEGQTSSFPGGITESGGRLFFSADDGITGRELWLLSLTGSGN